MAKRYWLLKVEPETYSIADLERDGRTTWEGVRNYQARNLLRDELQVGDGVLFYASSSDPSGVTGLAEVARAGYPDSFAWKKGHAYFDPASTKEKPVWYRVDVAFVDYNLGFMDGLDFVRMIRTAPDTPNPYLPIVMLTAYSETHRVMQARDAGVTEFCVKPVTAIEVYRKMVEVIDHPRPFVRTGNFFGPDRRRRSEDEEPYKGPERRSLKAADQSHAKVG